jgi:molybdenum cofactor cytidylyltransferase
VKEAPVGLLLAAGTGARFGADKRLHPLPHGEPLAASSARSLLAACPRVIALVRPEDEALAGLFARMGCEVRRVENAARGMGATLAAGIAAAGEAAGAVVALADMPWVRADTVVRVRDALLAGAALAAPFHAGRRGHPVGFARGWFAELARLDHDFGARALLARHHALITAIAVDDAGCLLDVDTPADLAGAPYPCR